MNKTCIALTATLLLCSAAAAQNAPPRPDPLDAKAATAVLVYRSAFNAYRPWSAESPPQGWRSANDAVERIGGWRAYAREANAPETAASAPPMAPKR